jgi:hypothetical protein
MNARLHSLNLVWLTVGDNSLDVNPFRDMFSTLNLGNKIGSFSFFVKLTRSSNLHEYFLINCIVKKTSSKVWSA